MTAAVACAATGLGLDLFEARPRLGGGAQISNSHRYVHPNIADWPREHASEPESRVKYLSWAAGPAGAVMHGILDQFAKVFPRWTVQNRMIGQAVERIHKHPTDRGRSVVVVPPRTIGYDAVILAPGFGRERRIGGFEPLPYWRADTLDEPHERIGRWAVVGTGDGGLIETLRLTIEDFDHRRFVETFLKIGGLALLGQRLLEIDAAARQRADRTDDLKQANDLLFSEYESLLAAKVVPDELISWLRGDQDVDSYWLRPRHDVHLTLFGTGSSPLTLNSNRFHRFCVYVLWSSRLGEPRFLYKGMPATAPVLAEYDHVVIRTRPDSEQLLRQLCPYLLASDKLKDQDVENRTTEQHWPDSFYPASVPEQTSPRGTITPLMDATDKTIAITDYAWAPPFQRDTERPPITIVPSFLDFLTAAWVTTGDVSPAGDLQSLEDFFAWHLLSFGARRPLERRFLLAAPEHDVTRLDADLCSIGGPVDHLLTRYALGYRKDRSRADYVLPYVFDLDRHDPPGRIDAATRRSHQVTQWKILDTESNALLVPHEPTGALIVALLPNTCPDKKRRTGRRHLVIAAANATGQSAIRSLLEGHTLTEVHSRLGAPEFFTAVLEAQTAVDRYGRRVPTGRIIALRERALRAADFERWPAFEEWDSA
jgi:hypothetical protein